MSSKGPPGPGPGWPKESRDSQCETHLLARFENCDNSLATAFSLALMWTLRGMQKKTSGDLQGRRHCHLEEKVSSVKELLGTALFKLKPNYFQNLEKILNWGKITDWKLVYLLYWSSMYCSSHSPASWFKRKFSSSKYILSTSWPFSSVLESNQEQQLSVDSDRKVKP